jgi:histidinol-phosphate phosphatase family protein
MALSIRIGRHLASASGPRPAFFVDRDGTLVRNVPYNADPTPCSSSPVSPARCAGCDRQACRVLVVSNQSAVARGLCDAAQVEAVNARLRALLQAAGTDVDAIYYCPHHPDHGPACDCRKAAPGLLLRAAADHGIDLERSVTVGDAARDLEAGRRAGTAAVLYDGVGSEGPGPQWPIRRS